jgi:AcrR family transcriptional regulator
MTACGRSRCSVGISAPSLLQHFGSKEGLLMAVLEDWDRRTVQTRLTGVTEMDYFRCLPEVMAAHLANRGLLELFSTIAAEASSPTHPARESFSVATPTTYPPSRRIFTTPWRPVRSRI